MPHEPYRHADPDGVIARFASTTPIARSPEGAYVAWRFSLREGLDPKEAAAIVLEAGVGRWQAPSHRRLRRLLERTRGLYRRPANDNALFAKG